MPQRGQKTASAGNFSPQDEQKLNRSGLGEVMFSPQ
jgi:hypothetical protein